MDRVELSTMVYLSQEEIYEFLVDFPRYANYSKYLTRVEADGDGGPGTTYDLTFAWWKLTYTVRSRVTAVDRPERIDWRVIRDIDADGRWLVVPRPEDAPDGRDDACRVHLVIEFDADSVGSDAVDLPRFVSLDWVIRRIKPLVLKEAERVTERIVADLEGDPRPVDLKIHEKPASV